VEDVVADGGILTADHRLVSAPSVLLETRVDRGRAGARVEDRLADGGVPGHGEAVLERGEAGGVRLGRRRREALDEDGLARGGVAALGHAPLEVTDAGRLRRAPALREDGLAGGGVLGLPDAVLERAPAGVHVVDARVDLAKALGEARLAGAGAVGVRGVAARHALVELAEAGVAVGVARRRLGSVAAVEDGIADARIFTGSAHGEDARFVVARAGRRWGRLGGDEDAGVPVATASVATVSVATVYG